jgi:hypothetical protein
MPRKKQKTLEQVTKQEEEMTLEETRTIKCDVPMTAYRALTKLAADQVPFVKVNQYSTNILVEHSAQAKTKK